MSLNVLWILLVVFCWFSKIKEHQHFNRSNFTFFAKIASHKNNPIYGTFVVGEFGLSVLH